MLYLYAVEYLPTYVYDPDTLLPLLFLLPFVRTISSVFRQCLSLSIHISLVCDTLGQILYGIGICILNGRCSLFRFFLFLSCYKTSVFLCAMRSPNHTQLYHGGLIFAYTKVFFFTPGRTEGLFPHLKAPKRAASNAKISHSRQLLVYAKIDFSNSALFDSSKQSTQMP